MSHIAVQRVVVRMLYDPRFVARVREDVEAATADCDLRDHERQWLLQADPRAFGVDPHRRARSLTGLLEEFAVSGARVVRRLGRAGATEQLDTFFSSATFHRGMQEGASLAATFARWLRHDADFVDATTGFLVDLEAGIARARREFDRHGPATNARVASLWSARLGLAPGVVVLELPAGTAAGFGAGLETLRRHPGTLIEAVLDEQALIEEPVLERAPEGVLVDGHDGDLRLEPMSAELARVLGLLSTERAFDHFAEAAAAFDATADDCISIAKSFVEDGIVVVGAQG